MRIFRSCRKIRKMTPLSRPFWPIFHCPASRIEKSSRLSPSSERKSATTTWFRLVRSRSASFASRRSRSAGDKAPAKSLIRLGAAGGIVSAAPSTAGIAATRSASANANRIGPTEPPPRMARLELDLGRDLAARRRLEVGLFLESPERGDEAGRELADHGVVGL